MPGKGFKCRQCGHCCLNLEDAYQTTAFEEDVLAWEAAERWDIVSRVWCWENEKGVLFNDIWINPRTGEEVNRCPWLRKLPNRNKYKCRINDLKPRHCREFPVSRKHARETGCPGYDPE